VPTPQPIPRYIPKKGSLFDPKSISLRTLPNGVRGLVKETRGTGLVTVQIWVRAGSRYESSETSGAAHLIETMALQASKNYPRKSGDLGGGASAALQALGGSVGSQTTRDATYYSATVNAFFAPAALRALADAVLRPNLSNPVIEEARLDVEGELARRGRDSITLANDLAYQIAFAKHPYRRPAVGTTSSVEALTTARVRAYHQNRYAGANITVVVVGDVAPQIIHTLIAQNFTAAVVSKTTAATIAPEQKPLAFKTVTRRIPGAATAIVLAFRSPSVKTPNDAVALDLLLAYWREGRDARMRRVLMGSQPLGESGGSSAPDAEAGADGATGPLALGYDIDYLTQRDPGLFLISLVVEPDKRAAAVTATLDEIARVQRLGLDEAALQRAKSVLTYQYVQQSDSVSGQAGALGFYDMIDSYQFAVTYLARIQRVSAADIKRVSAKYLARSSYVQAVIEPELAPSIQPPGEGAGAITASLNLGRGMGQ